MFTPKALRLGMVVVGCAALILALGGCSRPGTPTVSSTNPADGATGVPPNMMISATFSEEMDPATITPTTFTLSEGTTPVSGAVAYDGVTAIFSPATVLAPNTLYTATITTDARGSGEVSKCGECAGPPLMIAAGIGAILLAGHILGNQGGNALAEDYVWTFTTGATLDSTAPTVTSTAPPNGSTGVLLGRNLAATFSEAMNPTTISATSFTLARGATAVPGAVSYSGVTAIFTPTSALLPNTLYTATITTGAEDLAGNPLAANYVWTFTTGAAPDTTPPTVSSTDPADGAIDVSVDESVKAGKKIAATFSEAMNPLTVTTATFTLAQGMTPVSGSVTYSGVTAVFSPAGNLAHNTLYTATITTGAKDLAGNALAANFVWTFTTGVAPDITAPTVTFTDPADGATNVPVNKKVSATFSEAMDPLTISTASFTLRQGTTPVSGAVTYAGVTAVFSPTELLEDGAEYTATITSAAMDLSANALAADYVWTFNTGEILDTTAPTVTSTAPETGAAGVPLGANLAARFSEVMDALTITTATFTLELGTTPVSGSVIYAGVTAVFSPTIALLPNTLYTAAITTGAEDLAGNALAAEYVWTFTTGAAQDSTAPMVTSTAPDDSAIGVPLGSNLAATFSEPMDPLTINTATFILAQGTTPVPGTVTYAGVTAMFNPTVNLLPTTLYTATIANGAADLSGNGLAVDYVWTFSTGQSPDIMAPTVTFTAPANAAIGVPLGANLAATFSEAMDPLTISTATFAVLRGGAPVSGAVTYAGVTAMFNPTTALLPGTLYSATITTAAADLTGNALAANYIWTFTTGAAPDVTAPTVTSTAPANAAIGVPLGSNLAATFSEAMDPLTITTVTVTVLRGATPVLGAVTYAGVTAMFNPAVNLLPNTLYTATIGTGAADLSGNPLAANYIWTFTTGAAPDTTAPMVSSTAPAVEAIGVPLGSNMAATFTEAMDPLTISTAVFTLAQGATPVPGTVTYAGVTAMFNPTVNLLPLTLYTATIKAAAADLSGNPMVADYVWTFTTGVAPDITAPMVSSTAPENAAIGVPLGSNMAATFSEAMDPLTISTAVFTLAQGATPVPGTVTYAGVTAMFNPAVNLLPLTLYTATIKAPAADLSGNPMVADYVWTFTTGVAPDITAPMVSSTAPADGALDVLLGSNIAATFSEAMDPLTISTATFTLDDGMTMTPGTVTYVGVTAMFNPTGDLAPDTLYTAVITADAADLSGNTLAGDYTWTFTTGAVPDTIAPTVVLTDPEEGELGVPLNRKVAAAFSEAMDPLTINTLTFTLYDGTTPVLGTVAYAGVTATFSPTGGLAPDTLYTATVTTGAADLSGNPLAGDFVWVFTTGAAPDTTAPTVIDTNPANLDTGVCLSKAVTATFSEEMDPLTITTETFTLTGPGLTPVSGSVVYDGLTSVATFTPLTSLAASTEFTATVTTGAKDLAGNGLELDFVWSFTTGTQSCASELPIDLGSADTFGGIGGGAGMTNQGVLTVVNGDIGTTGASTLITGFHDTGGNIYTETPLNFGTVNGSIFTAPPAPGTATTFAIATQALADAQNAYDNILSPAALPGGTDPFAGQLGGKTVAPGVYMAAGGSFQITGLDLTLDAQGDPNAVWVFQSATSLTVGDTAPRSVILINGAQAKNVYWWVGSAATINGAGGGIMAGTIIAYSGVTFSTAGNVELTVLNGRALGLSASVTLVNTIINVPAP